MPRADHYVFHRLIERVVRCQEPLVMDVKDSLGLVFMADVRASEQNKGGKRMAGVVQ